MAETKYYANSYIDPSDGTRRYYKDLEAARDVDYQVTKAATISNTKAIASLPISNGGLPTSYTLEQSSNPAFTTTDKSAVDQVLSSMGGYLLLNKNGKTYAAKLNNDWSRFIDGTPISSDLEAVTETMIHVPKVYYKGEGKTVHIFGLQGPSDALTYDGPHWVGAYVADGDSKGIHSRPSTIPVVSQSMSTFDVWAKNLGSDWGQWKFSTWNLINLLYQAKFGNLNSQATIGVGFQYSDTGVPRHVPSGLTKSLGNGSGSVLYNDATIGNQYPVKLFGFEDLWGKIRQFTPGIRFYMDGSTRHAVIYDGNVVSNSATGRDVSPVLSSASGTYADAMQLGTYCDMICQSASGSSSTYYCDGYWAAAEGECFSVGAPSNLTTRSGLSCSHSDLAFDYASSRIGARLAFFSEPEIVTGNELKTLAGV